MQTKEILISGAGIAGSTLAYWLSRYGFAPTIVERASGFRDGGYIMDFWGVGYDVAEKMDLLPRLRELGYRNDRVVFVDETGRERSSFGGAWLREALANRYISIQRGDLARAIFEKIRDRVPIDYNDSIARTENYGSGCMVHFQSGEQQQFDLVIGAGGLHSKVRSLMPAVRAAPPHSLGYWAAAFICDGYSRWDEDTYVSFAVPARQISRFSLRNGRTGFLMVFARPGFDPSTANTIERQKEILLEVFDRIRWIEWPEISQRLEAAHNLYFDSVSQVAIPVWSEGRMALVGDAAYCPSLLAGEGASFAMAGAYILASELKRSGGDYATAFVLYENRFRDFIERKQRSARSFAASFAPRTSFGLFFRDVVLHLAAVPWVANRLLRHFVGDDFALPDYRDVNT